MNCNRTILAIILLSGFLIGQFPIQLSPNEMTDSISFTAGSDTEFLLSVSASANTNWSQAESESATLVVIIDGESTNDHSGF